MDARTVVLWVLLACIAGFLGNRFDSLVLRAWISARDIKLPPNGVAALRTLTFLITTAIICGLLLDLAGLNDA